MPWPVAAVPGLALANADLAKLMKDPKNWAAQAGDFSNQRYSDLKQINKSNVKDLKVAWTFSTGVLRGHEGGPLVIGDTLYVHSPFPNKVFAIDLETQKIKWKYEPKQDPSVIPVMCCDTVNRGLAYGEGKIFLQQADTDAGRARRQDRQEDLGRQERRSEGWRNQHPRSARVRQVRRDRYLRR